MDNKNKVGKKLKLMKINNLQLAFLKRHFSVFKKANELATLCGVDVAVIIGPLRNASIAELNKKVTVMTNVVEVEKKRGEELKKVMETEMKKHWFGAPIEELSLEQLEELKAKLVETKEKITKKVEELMKEAVNGGNVAFDSSGDFEVAHGFNHGEGPSSF